MRLRYTGSFPVSFSSIGVEVHPGSEFSVPDDDAPAYLTRSDVVAVEIPKPVAEKPLKVRRQMAEETAPVDQPVSTEESAADAESNAS